MKKKNKIKKNKNKTASFFDIYIILFFSELVSY